MGFWQGLDQGLTYVMEDKARKKELEDARQERAAERQANREYQLEDQKAANKLVIDKAMAELLSKTVLYDSEAKDIAHELSVLKSMGVSEDVLTTAATLDKTSLQQAVTYAKDMQTKYAGSPLEFGTAGLNAFLSSAVTTIKSGKTPNMDVAAKIFGIAPEDLDKEFVGGKTYKDVIAGALTTPPTQETTFLGTEGAAPLKLADIEIIKNGAMESLAGALDEKSFVVSSQAAALNTKSSTVPLTTEEKGTLENLNDQMVQIRDAKEALDKKSVGAAINLVGGNALIPYFINVPMAMDYEFGPEWTAATSRYTFNTREEMLAAYMAKKVFVGDAVIIAGKPGIVRE